MTRSCIFNQPFAVAKSIPQQASLRISSKLLQPYIMGDLEAERPAKQPPDDNDSQTLREQARELLADCQLLAEQSLLQIQWLVSLPFRWSNIPMPILELAC